MAFLGAKVVILLCFFVHYSLNANSILVQANTSSVNSFVSLLQGFTLLCFPVLGLVSDVCFNRYKLITVSIVSLLLFALLGMTATVVLYVVSTHHSINPMPWYIQLPVGFCSIGFVLSVGMFQAVGIQFGMDQMIEASSDQISTFIHWYYFSMNIGTGIQGLLELGIYAFLGSCQFEVSNIKHRPSWDVKLFMYTCFPVLAMQLVAALVLVLVFIRSRRYLAIEPTGRNQYIMIYKVLKYVWQHKIPEHRSALTYWEEDIPPRIDLGKSKYGGPFSTGEVEDIKTFLFLLLLVFLLFGFHLVDNGYSVIRQLSYKLCPSEVVYASVSFSPNILQSLTVVVFVPFLQFLVLPKLYRFVPNMLHRLGIGLTLVVFQELAGIVIVLSSWYKYSKCPPISERESFFVVAPIGDCFVSNSYVLSNNTCGKPALHDYCGEEDGLFLWSLLPGFTRIVAYHLVFMTALEFISAQAPLKMKGILISFWYALSCQQYFIQAAVFVYINKERVWLIFHGVKVFVILISLFLYCCVAKRYRYRLRDEVVNERYLVEEIYDRELRMAEEYEREKKEMMRAFYGRAKDIRSIK